MKKTLCIISHTHWDREWYKPYEVFRLKLVDLIDRLLKIIEKHPDYIFHLDAQTIVLEDYLEIRPSKKEILKKYIKSGNIIVGPWYLQNDFYLTGGEATIRNLMIGRKIAREFGKSAEVGYAPDQFGNISQLPQILGDFGIDSFVFARGFSEYYRAEDGTVCRCPSPLEFIWEGADGSKLLAFHMRGWYNNAQRIPVETEKAKKMADRISADFRDMAATEYYLLMNGVDHLEAQDDLFEAIENFNAEYGTEFTMKQYALEDYIADVKKSISDNNIKLTVHKGELRKGSTGDILPGTLSSRHYIKVANVKMQNMLEQMLEPLYSMLELAGMEGIYSSDHFRYAWKKLVQNHPHDTICGCSRDAVHKHSYDNYERLKEFADDMLFRGLYELAYHSKELHNTDYLITAVNTTALERTGIVAVTVDLPKQDNIKGFYIADTEGNKASFGISSKETLRRDVTSPLNLPGSVLVDRYNIYLDAGAIKPYAQKNFKLIPVDKSCELIKNRSERVLENEYIKVSVTDSGSIDITFKETGERLKDAIYFEDMGDKGSSYNFIDTGEKAITSKEFIPLIEVFENNRFCGKIKLTWEMTLPAHYDFEKSKRSTVTELVTVSLILELSASDKMLKLNYEINNRCRDHRLRLVAVSDYAEKARCFADIPFDIVERVDTHFEPDPPSQTFPNTSFVALEEHGKGIAILTEGAHEAEHISNGELAITLLRATGVIERGPDFGPIGGEMWVAEENQCMGTTKGRLALCGYRGNAVSADIPSLATLFRTPVCTVCVPSDRRVFSGGRPAVQDSAYSEIYYLPDPWQDISIKDNAPALEIKGEGIAVSAVKLSEDEKGIIVRFYNYSDADTVAAVAVNGNIYRSDMAEDSRILIGKHRVELNVAPKKIITLYIEKNEDGR